MNVSPAWQSTITPAAWTRALGVALCIPFLMLWADHLLTAALHPELLAAPFGVDYVLYDHATARWLSGGPWYEPAHVAAPYAVKDSGAIMYPPPALLLFAPFAVLPDVLWWVIPIAIVVGVVAWHRPRPLVWPILAMLLWFPTTTEVVYAGNPAMWMVAAIAAGTVWHWPAVLVLLKPTLAPLALIGVRRRSWWIALGVLALVSVPFLPMWPEFFAVALNARDQNGGLMYSVNQIPTMLIPVVAWLGGTRLSHRSSIPRRG